MSAQIRLHDVNVPRRPVGNLLGAIAATGAARMSAPELVTTMDARASPRRSKRLGASVVARIGVHRAVAPRWLASRLVRAAWASACPMALSSSIKGGLRAPVLTGACANAVTPTPLGLFQIQSVRAGCGGAAPRYQCAGGWPIVTDPPPLAVFGGGFPLAIPIFFFPLVARPRSASAWHRLRGF